MLSKLEISIPFTEAILQIPSYTRFLKEVLTKKRSIGPETVLLSHECSAIVNPELPIKRKDPGSFSIPCKVGDVEIQRALCDLGASVSIIPFSLYERLNMGVLKPTRMAIQLADRSVKYPVGILEDVPLKVGSFYIPVDFVVLEMDEDVRVPIILGRPFLNTADAVIHVRDGRLTLKVGDEVVEFNLAKNLKEVDSYEECRYADILDPIPEGIYCHESEEEEEENGNIEVNVVDEPVIQQGEWSAENAPRMEVKDVLSSMYGKREEPYDEPRTALTSPHIVHPPDSEIRFEPKRGRGDYTVGTPDNP
jgi:hypothetical protein